MEENVNNEILTSTPITSSTSSESTESFDSWTLVANDVIDVDSSTKKDENKSLQSSSTTTKSDDKDNDKVSNDKLLSTTNELSSGIEYIGTEEEPAKLNENDELSDEISIISDCESVDRITPSHQYIHNNHHQRIIDENINFIPLTPPNTPNYLNSNSNNNNKSSQTPSPSTAILRAKLYEFDDNDLQNNALDEQRGNIRDADTSVDVARSLYCRISIPISAKFIILAILIGLLAFIGNNFNFQSMHKEVPELMQRVQDLELQNNLLRAEIDILSKNLHSVKVNQNQQNSNDQFDDGRKFDVKNNHFEKRKQKREEIKTKTNNDNQDYFHVNMEQIISDFFTDGDQNNFNNLENQKSFSFQNNKDETCLKNNNKCKDYENLNKKMEGEQVQKTQPESQENLNNSNLENNNEKERDNYNKNEYNEQIINNERAENERKNLNEKLKSEKDYNKYKLKFNKSENYNKGSGEHIEKKFYKGREEKDKSDEYKKKFNMDNSDYRKDNSKEYKDKKFEKKFQDKYKSNDFNKEKYRNRKRFDDDDDDDDDSKERFKSYKKEKRFTGDGSYEKNDSKEYHEKQDYKKIRNDNKFNNNNHANYKNDYEYNKRLDQYDKKIDDDWYEKMMKHRESTRRNNEENSKENTKVGNNWYLERGNGRKEARIYEEKQNN